MDTTLRNAAGSLVERYVHAATRRLPDDQRADVADELRATLADQVEDLVAGGASTAEAERAAVTELGDPDRLAAGYTGAPQHLIGPDVFPAWRRVVTGVLAVAVPAATVVVAVVAALTGASVGGVIGQAVWTAFLVATQVLFWVTLAFALVERGEQTEQVRRQLAVDWTPDQLPDVPDPGRPPLKDVVASVVSLGLIAAAIVWQAIASPIHADGERLPFLDPDLWSFWLPLILVLIAVEAGFEIAKHRLGGWSTGTATANVLLGVLFTAPWAYLAATDRLLNPAAVAAIRDGWPGFSPGVANAVVVAIAVVVWAWDGVGGFVNARRRAR